MCSIVGISFGPGGHRRQRWSVTELAQLMLRSVAHVGPDAFGLMWCTRAGEVHAAKWVGSAGNPGLLAEVDIPGDAAWFVGHVRDSRRGGDGRGSASEPANNHPVRHGNIIGVHAGLISNHRRILARTGRADDRAEVDSEAVFAAVARLGPVAGLASVNGHLAVGFADVLDPATVRLARSWGAGWLHLARTGGGALAFASHNLPLAVIGATDDIVRVTGRYQLLTIHQGRITGQRQYRPIRWIGRDGANRIRRITEVTWRWATSPMRPAGEDRGQPVPFEPASLLADLAATRGTRAALDPSRSRQPAS
jgi:Glutamine amidotransferase domain